MFRTALKAFLLATFFSQALPASAQAPAPSFPRTELSIGMFRVNAEVAASEDLRMYGLMFRKEMPSNAGMVFVFETSQQYCMWMKNTLLPLSVAFIDETGKIINIEDMKPQTENSHCAEKPARFALEMNKGWFKDKHFKAGTKVGGLERFGATR
ncbi:DUF192 domain-containing protein [Uliginosibacterium sp. H3]|uniref:DUF192 domain-containing protein n=1 Tax=Uliginosibacterium silvisoli TaxID=3114758 RepID=A0ABU6JZ98_9RHOO|nr:DUF192 domain-containing protein [Uliginosibacterium sp. H3]